MIFFRFFLCTFRLLFFLLEYERKHHNFFFGYITCQKGRSVQRRIIWHEQRHSGIQNARLWLFYTFMLNNVCISNIKKKLSKQTANELFALCFQYLSYLLLFSLVELHMYWAGRAPRERIVWLYKSWRLFFSCVSLFIIYQLSLLCLLPQPFSQNKNISILLRFPRSENWRIASEIFCR